MGHLLSMCFFGQSNDFLLSRRRPTQTTIQLQMQIDWAGGKRNWFIDDHALRSKIKPISKRRFIFFFLLLLLLLLCIRPIIFVLNVTISNRFFSFVFFRFLFLVSLRVCWCSCSTNRHSILAPIRRSICMLESRDWPIWWPTHRCVDSDRPIDRTNKFALWITKYNRLAKGFASISNKQRTNKIINMTIRSDWRQQNMAIIHLYVSQNKIGNRGRERERGVCSIDTKPNPKPKLNNPSKQAHNFFKQSDQRYREIQEEQRPIVWNGLKRRTK